MAVEGQHPGRHGGLWPPTSTSVSPSPATTCAFVTTRSFPALHPEPSIASPQAVPITRTTSRAADLTAASPTRRGSGARRRRGAGDRRQRIEAGHAPRIGPEGGSSSSAPEDHRALDVGPQLGLARRLGRHGGGDPHDPEAEGDAEGRAEDAVEHAEARHHQAAADSEAEALEAGREQRPGQQRAEQAEGGGVGEPSPGAAAAARVWFR